MNKLLVKYAIIIGAYAAVLYPLWMRLRYIQWGWDSTLYLSLFPLFGLAAFSMLWLHAISGVFEPWLRKNFNFDRFVDITSKLILVCIVAHPLLLILSPSITLGDIFLRGNDDIGLGIAGLSLLLIYDITKPLKKQSNYFVQHWKRVLVISNIGFILILFHSLDLGSDLQLPPLRYLWIFYSVTAIAALIYTYGIKKTTE